MKKVILLFISIFNLYLYANNNYGWNVPHTPLNIGGYLDMTYDTKRDNRFLFNDIAVLFSANRGLFDLLGEIEYSNVSLDGKSNNRYDLDVHIERLEVSYTLNDMQMFKVGRFNSDIGYWNQAPIMILQDTSSSPYMIKNLIPKATTGLLFRQTINENNTLAFTFQHNSDLSHQDNTIQTNRHKSIAYYGTKEDFSWHLSSGIYSNSAYDNMKYLGVACAYESEKFLLQGAFFFHKLNKIERNYNGYIQSSWHFWDKQDFIFRFEKYEDNIKSLNDTIYLWGYAYRPTSNSVLKGEYLHFNTSSLNRFIYSISVLF